MTNTIKIKPFQTTLDIALQEYGTVEALGDLLVKNDLQWTQDLTAGSSVEIVESSRIEKEILKFYKAKGIYPATLRDQEASGIIPSIKYSYTPLPKDENVKVLPYQTLLDIALQVGGTIECLFELSLLNEISISQSLMAGTELKNSISTTELEILTYYKKKNIHPATEYTFEAQSIETLFEAGLFEPGLFE